MYINRNIIRIYIYIIWIYRYILYIIGTYVMKIYEDLVIICYDNTIINHPMNQTLGEKMHHLHLK